MGLDAKRLASIINSSSGRCWSSDTYNPVPNILEGIPSSNNYLGGFKVSLMAKVFCIVYIVYISIIHCNRRNKEEISRIWFYFFPLMPMMIISQF